MIIIIIIIIIGKVRPITLAMKPQIRVALSVISSFRREVAKKCALLGYYEAGSGKFLLTFRNNISVPSSGIKK